MPAIIYSGPPYKCPICGERLWNEDRLLALYTPWQATKLRKEYYNKHMQDHHPDFNRWNKRAFGGYIVTVSLVFASLIIGRLAFNASTTIIIELLFAIVLGSSVILVSFQMRAKKQSRQLWRERPDSSSSKPHDEQPI